MRRVASVWLSAILAMLLLAASAQAFDVTFGARDGGHPYYGWNFDGTTSGTSPAPQGTCVAFIEVAGAPSTGSDGYFYSENIVAAGDGLDFNGCSRQSEWLSSSPLPPGTYFIHARHELNDPYPYYDTWWGPIFSFTIGAGPPPTTQPPSSQPVRPTISEAAWSVSWRAGTFRVKFTACDDSPSYLKLRGRTMRGAKERFWIGRLVGPAGTCPRYATVRQIPRFVPWRGRFTVEMWVLDPQNQTSNTMRHRFGSR